MTVRLGLLGLLPCLPPEAFAGLEGVLVIDEGSHFGGC